MTLTEVYRAPRRLPLLLRLVPLLLCAAVLAGCLPAAVAGKPEAVLPTVIYNSAGQEVYRFHAGQDRQPVSLATVPAHVRAAFIAVEDPRFYDHPGIDLPSVFRAALHNTLRAAGWRRSGLQGASTITQQLARNLWLGHEQTWQRKLSEALLALRLELTYSKDEILELYLNQIYFGNGAYGIDRAARRYFGKAVPDLTVAEAAMLAGLINGPTLYDPYAHPDAARERRDLVLAAMVRNGALTPEAAATAKAEPASVGAQEPAPNGNSYVDHVIDILTRPDLAARHGVVPREAAALATAGLKVYTALDGGLQALAESAVREIMAAADREYGLAGAPERPEAAAVLLDPVSGRVLALVGGRIRSGMRQYNRAADARRQPGSAFKPFAAYLPALEAGLGPATILDDAPAALTADGRSLWPENYDHRYRGLVPLRYAVEQSLNAPAVRAMRAAGGAPAALAYARRLGFEGLTEQDAGEALALGGLTQGVTPLEMASAYGTLAYLGTRVSPTFILRIEDARGRILYTARPRKEQPVTRAAAYLMADILRGVIRQGTAYGHTRGFHGWPAAGKTGTSDGNLDAWFAGFTPELVGVVWTGYDAPRPLPWTGAFVPVRIWNRIMTQAVTAKPPEWRPPPDLVLLTVCRRTGKLPTEICPEVVTELFHRSHLPRDAGQLLVRATAVASPEGWLLWQEGCSGTPENRLFIRRPEPYLRHPSAPHDPRWLPADADAELPSALCTPAPRERILWRDLLPPWLGGRRPPKP
jgi:penicillin-binding protein 1A